MMQEKTAMIIRIAAMLILLTIIVKSCTAMVAENQYEALTGSEVRKPDYMAETVPEGTESLNFGGPAYKITTKTDVLGSTQVDVDFLREIVGIDSYSGLLEKIISLKANDTLIMHFSNFGGSVYTGAALFNAITQTKAHTKAIIEAPSFSMGAMLPCAAKEIELQPYSFLMYHDYSGGSQGKGSEMLAELSNFSILTNKMMQECVKHGILSQDEVTQIQNGRDIYKHPEDLK